jgi:hypothetical protein
MEAPPNQALQRTAHKAAPPLSFRVDMTSDVKSGAQRFEVCLMFFLLGAWEEVEPVRSDG